MNRLGNVKVLILDDHKNMRSLWRSMLMGFGIRSVYEAKDAYEALEVLRSNFIDILIVDFHLDGLTGAEFVGMLRRGADSPAPHIPVIACSGDSRPKVLRKWIDAGVDEILAKPVSAEQAWQKMCMLVNRRRTFVRLGKYSGPDRRRRASPYVGDQERRVYMPDDCLLD
ncbi:response regulator [Hirschia baltica]|uniref:Response regulator receiver protein n=1 Tax=Hirschia baltica (strain ATCC 49814 / DSM 5838 / IFAM 1418) TaxID=582402 RepID=C6XRF1_HIRBI|nr:response regulator [Hirschia baltica]ACT58783.1 response regulator receiver protein [Hirschia baltica ATCC 49814]